MNCLFSEIIQLSTSDIDYCEHRRQLDINWTELYPWKSQPLLAPPISKHVLDMRKCMLEFWSSFPNLYELLEILAHNPWDLYIWNDPDIFYPQYEALISSFYTVIEQYNKWEISQYDADNKYGVDDNTNITDHQIHEWYISLKQCRLEQAIQCFCSFLLKSWEFDLYTNRVNIKEYVLQLWRTLGGENLAEIAWYDFWKTFTDDRNPLVLDFLPQDEFLWRLRAGVAILNNYAESKSELYDYDILALIDLAVRERLIENKMGKQLSLLDDSSQIIYQIFLAVIHNNYLDRIWRDDLQVEFEKHHYALIMLFKD